MVVRAHPSGPDMTHIAPAREWQSRARRRAGAAVARRFSARAAQPDRDASGLRARSVRRLHHSAGRRADPLLPDLRGGVRRPRCRDHRRLRRRPHHDAHCAQAFHQHHALQCGFCTPGMLITARDIIRRNRAGSEQEIRKELAGNICRCTGYTNIVTAIGAAAAALAAERSTGTAGRRRFRHEAPGQRDCVRRRRLAAPQGGRAPFARPRPVRRRREAAGHPGRGVCPQPARACAHQGHRGPPRSGRAGVHRARSAAAHRDAGGAAGERVQGFRISAAGHAKGAICRRAHRRLHRADARRSRGPRQFGERRVRGAAGGRRCRRGREQAAEPGARELEQQPVHRADVCGRQYRGGRAHRRCGGAPQLSA